MSLEEETRKCRLVLAQNEADLIGAALALGELLIEKRIALAVHAGTLIVNGCSIARLLRSGQSPGQAAETLHQIIENASGVLEQMRGIREELRQLATRNRA